MIINMKYIVIFSQAMAFSMVAISGTPQTSEEHGRLACGDVFVESETHYVDYPDISFERQVEKQVISIIGKNGGSKTHLKLDSRSIRKATFDNKILLDSAVVSWACLKAKDGQNYIFLWYACTTFDELGFCSGRFKEWERLFKTDGEAIAVSYKRNYDRRYESLYKKLGLEDVRKDLEMESLVADEQCSARRQDKPKVHRNRNSSRVGNGGRYKLNFFSPHTFRA